MKDDCRLHKIIVLIKNNSLLVQYISNVLLRTNFLEISVDTTNVERIFFILLISGSLNRNSYSICICIAIYTVVRCKETCIGEFCCSTFLGLNLFTKF